MMKSTRNRSENVPPYIGADLTDRYSGGNEPRAIDACGLIPDGPKLHARFWKWIWDPGHATLDVGDIAEEIRVARWTMIDGPQALASPGSTLRVCERESGAAGKTGSDWAEIQKLNRSRKMFAGYVLSSLELFRALNATGIVISPKRFIAPAGGPGCVGEYYPGDLWNKRIVTPAFKLNNKSKMVLRKKGSPEGRMARNRLLRALGVVFPNGDSLSHDQLDACLGAVLGAVADGKISGVSIGSIGQDLTGPDNQGYLREGPMAILEVKSESLALEIRDSIKSEWLVGVDSATSVKVHHLQAQAGSRRPNGATDEFLPRFSGKDPRSRALELQAWLVGCADRAEPSLCTYWAAYQRIFEMEGNPFSPEYARQVI
jgi:hypothetical protein